MDTTERRRPTLIGRLLSDIQQHLVLAKSTPLSFYDFWLSPILTRTKKGWISPTSIRTKKTTNIEIRL